MMTGREGKNITRAVNLYKVGSSNLMFICTKKRKNHGDALLLHSSWMQSYLHIFFNSNPLHGDFNHYSTNT